MVYEYKGLLYSDENEQTRIWITWMNITNISLNNNSNKYDTKEYIHTGWCGSVDWAPACKPKGCQFNSQSGHMPGLWTRSPVGGHIRGNHTLMFFFLSFSLPSPLSKNKQNLFKKIALFDFLNKITLKNKYICKQFNQYEC